MSVVQTEHTRLGKYVNTDILGFVAHFSWTMVLKKGFISYSLGKSAYIKVFRQISEIEAEKTFMLTCEWDFLTPKLRMTS